MTNVISVDFRRGRLSIDDDLYCERVTEIHCRCCSRRSCRKGAIELGRTWGYICENCKDKGLGLLKPSKPVSCHPAHLHSA